MRILPEFVLPTATQTGTLTNGSPCVTGLSDTSLLQGALTVTGTGIPLGTYVLSIDSATQITLTQNATASGSQSLTCRIEPIMLAEAKKQLRLEIPDDDDLVVTLITTARRTCETLHARAYITQTRTLYLDSFPSAGGYYNRAIREVWPSAGSLPSGLGFYPGLVPNSTGVIDIPLPPLQSITAVQYTDFSGATQTFPTESYGVSLGTPARIQPAYSHIWPISRPTIDSVQIIYVCGYGDTAAAVPDPVKSAMKLLIGTWYENRESIAQMQMYPVPDTVGLILANDDPGLYY
jgi:hypothetical protein